ncbi:MAG TPA: GAF domain-containing protein [Anaerolineales bacterium]
MNDQKKLEGELSRVRGRALQARQAEDWATALEAYAQGLAFGDLTAMHQAEFHEGRAACYRELSDHTAEAEELHKANLLLREESDKLLEETRQRNAELAVINSVQRGLASYLDMHGIYDAVGEKLREIFDVQTISIYAVNLKTRIITSEYTFEKGQKFESISVPFNSLYEYVLGLDSTFVKNGDFPQFAAQFKDYKVPQGEIPKSVVVVPVTKNKNLDLAVFLSLQDMDGEKIFSDSDIRLLETLASSMSVALENARHFDEAQQRTAELSDSNKIQAALYHIADAATVASDMSTFYRRIHHIVQEMMRAENFIIQVFDEETQRVSYPYVVDTAGELESVAPVPIAKIRKGLAIYVLKTGKTVHVSRSQVDEMVDRGEIERIGSSAEDWVGVPLQTDGRTIGVIAVQQYEPGGFYTEKDVRLLEFVAQHIATSLERARAIQETQRLLNETEQRAAELAIINRIQQGLAAQLDMQAIYDLVGDKMREIFDADVVQINIYDRTRNLLSFPYCVEKGERHQHGSRAPWGFRENVLRTRQTLVVNENVDRLAEEMGNPTIAGQSPQAIVFVPLLVGDEVIGICSLQNIERERKFTPADVRLLTTLANSMSIALENARLFDEIQTRNREIGEALKRERATGQILGVIASSPTEIQPVLDVIAENAARLSGSDDAIITYVEGEFLRLMTHYGPIHILEVGDRLPLNRETVVGRAVLERRPLQTIHEPGREDSEYPAGDANAGRFGYRMTFSTPLLRHGVAIGAITIRHVEPKLLTERQIELVGTFADQAVIAIENVRLFDEVQKRNQEISEALEQQTATSEVLRALSGFQPDLRSLLEIIAVNAAKVCGADDAHIYRIELETLKEWTHRGPIPGLEAGESLPLNRSSLIGRAIVDRQTIHIRDAAVELDENEYPVSAFLQRRWGYRTVLATPLLRDGEPIGGIAIRRKELQPFTEKQIELIKTFADQAVIAIENVRLFDETQRLLKDTQQRNAELAIINSVQEGLASKLDFKAIIDLVGDKIREIFDAQSVAIGTYDHANGLVDYSYVVQKGRRVNMKPTPFAGMSRYMINTRRTLVINENVPQRVQEIGAIFPSDFDLPRSTVYVPLLVGETVTGVINVANLDREHAFSASDVRLLQTLANSLAVALENARLFEETQRLLKETEQRAAELAAINRVSNALVAEQNLDALIQIAGEQLRQIFNADIAYVALLDPETKLILFPYQYGEEFSVLQLGEGLTSKIIESGKPLLINQDIEQRRAALGAKRVGKQARSYLGVPIFVGRQAIGAISVQSTQTEGRYTEDDVRLLSTIAANVGTAIRNANLFDEINYQKKYYEMIIANSPAAIILLDEEAKVTGWNPAAERLFGYSRAEAMGRDVDNLVANQEQIQAEAAAASRRGIIEGQVHLIAKRTRKDGTLVDVEIMALPVIVDGRQTGYIAIYHDITELQRARQEAIRANQAKSAFLANMSHELRTPLNAIIGFSRIVKRKAEGVLPEKQVENLDKVLVSAEHLLGLINTVLDIAKIEAGRVEVQPSTFTVENLVDLCINTSQPLVRSGVRLVKEVQPGLPLAHSDQDKVKQIVLNLLSNAAKFTHAGQITLRAALEDGLLALSVSDTGIGIPPEALDRIFEEFQQVDTSTTRQYGGTGLGLSISRSLARLLGGEMSVSSQVGEGSIFTLTVPLHYGEQPGKASLAAADVSPEPAPQTGQPVVLAIDDDPDVVYLLGENLAEAGYQVIGASSGQEGMQKARSLKPFAITLDIMMPNKDGWQVLHELKSDPDTRSIPVILLSIIDNKELGYRLGAADYLVKPFDQDDMLAALQRLAKANQGVQPRRLLVVDDDPQVIDMVRRLLEGSEYQISAAGDGEQALESIAESRPDAILLDLLMPRLDGFGVIERLQQDPLYSQIPVIVLTAKSLDSAEAKKLQETVATIVQKQGLDGQVLLKEIQAALKEISSRDNQT